MRKALLMATGLALSVAVSSLAGTVPIKEGWNLVGSSCGFDVSEVQSDPNLDKITTIWQWDADNKGWLVWSPNESIMELLEQFGLKSFDRVGAYKGFWVNAKDNFTVELCEYNCTVETAPVVDLGEGLVAHYSFDTCTAKDDSGNGKDAAISGVAECVDGLKDRGLKLDGGDVINLPVDLLNGTETATINVWVNSSLDGFWLLHGSNDQTSHEYSVEMYPTNGMESLYDVYYHGNCFYTYDYAEFSPDEFHMITLSYDHTIADTIVTRIYVDGELRATVSTPSETPISLTKLTLGEGADGVVFDELSFYNRVLSDEEIKKLYDQYAPFIENVTENGTVVD